MTSSTKFVPLVVLCCRLLSCAPRKWLSIQPSDATIISHLLLPLSFVLPFPRAIITIFREFSHFISTLQVPLFAMSSRIYVSVPICSSFVFMHLHCFVSEFFLLPSLFVCLFFSLNKSASANEKESRMSWTAVEAVGRSSDIRVAKLQFISHRSGQKSRPFYAKEREGGKIDKNGIKGEKIWCK